MKIFLPIVNKCCVLCNKIPKVRKYKPGFSREGLCRSCFHRRRYYSNWSPDLTVGSVDFELFIAKDTNGNPLSKKFKFEWIGLCGHSIKTSCHKEKMKSKRPASKPWWCASCVTKQAWADPVYAKTHIQALRIGHNKPESKERHAKASRRNFENPDFVAKHRTYAGYLSTKSGYYKNIFFRSSWEIKIATVLDILEIKWEYEAQRFSLPSLNNKGYIPDFYLSEYDLYLEIKGWYHDYAQAQHEAFIKDIGKPIFLINKNHYDQICLESNYLKDKIHENSTHRNLNEKETCS